MGCTSSAAVIEGSPSEWSSQAQKLRQDVSSRSVKKNQDPRPEQPDAAAVDPLAVATRIVLESDSPEIENGAPETTSNKSLEGVPPKDAFNVTETEDTIRIGAPSCKEKEEEERLVKLDSQPTEVVEDSVVEITKREELGSEGRITPLTRLKEHENSNDGATSSAYVKVADVSVESAEASNFISDSAPAVHDDGVPFEEDMKKASLDPKQIAAVSEQEEVVAGFGAAKEPAAQDNSDECVDAKGESELESTEGITQNEAAEEGIAESIDTSLDEDEDPEMQDSAGWKDTVETPKDVTGEDSGCASFPEKSGSLGNSAVGYECVVFNKEGEASEEMGGESCESVSENPAMTPEARNIKSEQTSKEKVDHEAKTEMNAFGDEKIELAVATEEDAQVSGLAGDANQINTAENAKSIPISEEKISHEAKTEIEIIEQEVATEDDTEVSGVIKDIPVESNATSYNTVAENESSAMITEASEIKPMHTSEEKANCAPAAEVKKIEEVVGTEVDADVSDVVEEEIKAMEVKSKTTSCSASAVAENESSALAPEVNETKPGHTAEEKDDYVSKTEITTFGAEKIEHAVVIEEHVSVRNEVNKVDALDARAPRVIEEIAEATSENLVRGFDAGKEGSKLEQAASNSEDDNYEATAETKVPIEEKLIAVSANAVDTIAEVLIQERAATTTDTAKVGITGAPNETPDENLNEELEYGAEAVNKIPVSDTLNNEETGDSSKNQEYAEVVDIVAAAEMTKANISPNCEDAREGEDKSNVESEISDDQRTRMAELLNVDPWSSDNVAAKVGFSELEVLIEENPKLCAETYKLDSFNESVYPLSALCSIGAPVELVTKCIDAYENALSEKDPWIGNPLHYACAHQAKLPVIEALVDRRPACLTEANEFQRFPLHMACMFGAGNEVITYLLQKNSSASEAMDREGLMPLHLACDGDDLDLSVVERLVTAHPGACTVRSIANGWTPLVMALTNVADLNIVKKLGDTDIEVHQIVDYEGNTPLHFAISSEASVEVCQYLTESSPGAVGMKNDDGETPVALAERSNIDQSIIEILKKQG